MGLAITRIELDLGDRQRLNGVARGLDFAIRRPIAIVAAALPLRSLPAIMR